MENRITLRKNWFQTPLSARSMGLFAPNFVAFTPNRPTICSKNALFGTKLPLPSLAEGFETAFSAVSHN